MKHTHKHTRIRIRKERILVKKHKKDCKKLLTRERISDNICKHSSRETRGKLRNDLRRAKKRGLKKLKKSFGKVLTKGCHCDILFELSQKRAANWTLKIKQRDKKRNPRFDSRRYYQRKSFKSTFQTVIRNESEV